MHRFIRKIAELKTTNEEILLEITEFNREQVDVLE